MAKAVLGFARRLAMYECRSNLIRRGPYRALAPYELRRRELSVRDERFPRTGLAAQRARPGSCRFRCRERAGDQIGEW